MSINTKTSVADEAYNAQQSVFKERARKIVMAKFEKAIEHSKIVVGDLDPEKIRAKKKANRDDKDGKQIDAGSWSTADFMGKYHVAHLANRFPIPGSAIAIDKWRMDHREDVKDQIEANVREKQRQTKVATKAKLIRAEFNLKTDHDVRFNNRGDEVERLLNHKDKTCRDLETAANAIQKQFADQDATETPAFVQDAKDGNMERMELVLRHEFAGEELMAGMTEWEMLQHQSAMERMDLYRIPNIDMVDPLYGNTALMYAVDRGDVPMVRLLFKYGANVNFCNHLGESPIHHCWREWDIKRVSAMQKAVKLNTTYKLVRMLLDQGAVVDAVETTHRYNVFHLTALYGPGDLMQYLLQQYPQSDLFAQDKKGRTPLAICQQLGKTKSHAFESANLLKRWHACQKQLKLAEFYKDWSKYLKDPKRTLINLTGSEIMDELMKDERKHRGKRFARGNEFERHDDPLTDYDPVGAEKEDQLKHEQMVVAQNARDFEMLKHATPKAPHPGEFLKIRLDDYLHRGAFPGFIDRQGKSLLPGEDNEVADQYCVTKEQLDAKKRVEKEAEDKVRREDDLADMKVQDPLRWRRIMTAREIVKDTPETLAARAKESAMQREAIFALPAGSVKIDLTEYGRPAHVSKIARSMDCAKNNKIHSDPLKSSNRIQERYINQGAFATQLLTADQKKGMQEKGKAVSEEEEEAAGELVGGIMDSADARGDAAKGNPAAAGEKLREEDMTEDPRKLLYGRTRAPINQPYARTSGYTFGARGLVKVGGEWRTPADRVRPNHSNMSGPIADPWGGCDQDYVSVNPEEDRFSKMPIEGFNNILGRDTYQPSKNDPRGTVLEIAQMRLQMGRSVDGDEVGLQARRLD
jgi:hypothetical protein